MTFLGTVRLRAVPLDVWFVPAAFVVAAVFMRHHPFTARIASVTANQGQNLILAVFATSVIGGTQVRGALGGAIRRGRPARQGAT